jgi:hypothetical protein
MNSGIFEMFEEKTFFFKLSFKWYGSGYTKIYEIGGVVENLSVVDVYPRMDLCTLILFLGEASNKISRRKNHSEKFKSSRRVANSTPNMWNIFGIGWNVYAVEEPFLIQL